MRIVVSDSSCLIDLRKASLLDAFLTLPYEVLIPNTLFEDELLKFTATEKRTLLRNGLKVVDVPGRACCVRARSFNRRRDSPFMTGLRSPWPRNMTAASWSPGIDCSEPWPYATVSRFTACSGSSTRSISTGLRTPSDLVVALRLFEQDSTVRLPRRDLLASIRLYEGRS
jgi:hypothetical protein